jgi:hypothetical protein
MIVPAVTTSPSLNLVRAKSLAAASLSNVLVRRGCRRLDSVPSGGTSKVTYQVCFMPQCRPGGTGGLSTPEKEKPPPGRNDDGFFLARETGLYRRAPTRLTPPFALPPAL